MGKFIKLTLNLALLGFVINGNAIEKINAEKIELTYIGQDKEYHAAIDSLLNDNYNNEEAKKVLKEIEDYGVYAGPFYGKYKNKDYIVLTKRDGRPYGYDNDRCFVLLKNRSDLYNVDAQTSLFEKPCEVVEEFQKRAIYPIVDGYKSISEDGKGLLIQLSSQKWQAKKSIRYKDTEGYIDVERHEIGEREVVREMNFKSTFSFNIHADFKLIDFDMTLRKVSWAGSSSHSYPTNVNVTRLMERQLDNGKIEVLIWMNRPIFMAQEARKLSVTRLVDGLFNVGNEILDYDYELPDSYGQFVDMDYSYLVLSYDPQNEERLDLRFHLLDVDHRHKSESRDPLTLTYYLE